MSPEHKRGSIESGLRLKEILFILIRHKIIKGLSPEKLRLILEDLGPTFIKLGQILSMRTDMIPGDYCVELAKLRSHVAPMSQEEVQAALCGAFDQQPDEIFSQIDEEPLGSASIAQVHLAELKDGSPVVLKVQRPDIYDVMSLDISLLRRASIILKLAGDTGEVIDFPTIIDELWAVAQEEMNFLIEARNIEDFYELNREVAYVTCPRVYRDLSTEQVLVMEHIDGLAIDDVEALKEAGYDLNEIGLKLADNFLKQVIDDGFFQADPHPANLKIRDGKIVWIDLGMMGRLSKKDRNLIQQALIAVAKNDIGELKDAVLAMSRHRSDIDHAGLYSELDSFLIKYGTVNVGELKVAQLLEDLFAIASSYHLIMPSGVALLGRGVATLEGVLTQINPEINLLKVASNRFAGTFFKDFNLKDQLTNNLTELYDSGRKAMHIPALISDLLKMSAKGQAKVNFELSGTPEFIRNVDHMIDKLIIGILVAALLLGSSLLSTTSMTPQLFGIPAVGIVGYAAAVALMGWLLIDKWRRRK